MTKSVKSCLELNSTFFSWTDRIYSDIIECLGYSGCGIVMIKCLLTLMLVTAQLLAGNSGSLYLCIREDGSYCCLDTGPVCCTCCHDHKALPQEVCCADSVCDEESVSFSHKHHEDDASPPRQFDRLAGDSCGCTHIPVTVSADQPTTVIRLSITTESERLALLLAWLPSLHPVSEPVAVTSPHLRRSDPSAAPDFALTVISTVVTRC